ncbi:MAG TPA: aminodeoxychorismate synthase component I [Bacteroidales bacterium]|nr:aminodeoxychorismate synthase component I [Bacteroidales bacterium]
MTELDHAIHRMNQWGGAGKPFFFLFDFDLQKPIVLPLDETADADILISMPNYANVVERINPSTPILEHDGYDLDCYASQFQTIMNHLRAGDSFLVNLTCQTPVRLNLPFDRLFESVRAKYKLLFKNQFLVFSPETFVQIHQGEISSCPMKGTLDASLPNAMQQLLDNPKEKAEHSTIVDLIRNDLSVVATNVQVKRFRYIEEISAGKGRLLQASSEITGILPVDYPSRIGDILVSLLPAGSVTGAPKKRTVEIIRETEIYDRGYYTGIFGIFDGINLDSAVSIRFMENTPNGVVYKSGGGITAQSVMKQEYDEMIQKIYVPLH